MTIELPVLGLLNDRPMHGYELRRALERTLLWPVSWGSLYPMLKKLVERGYLEKTSEAQENVPDRIVYRLTSRGQTRLIDLLTATDDTSEPGHRNDFHMKLAFFHLLSPSQRLEVLEAQKLGITKRLSALQAETRERQNRYREALLEYALVRLQADLEWVDSLVAREQQGE